MTNLARIVEHVARDAIDLILDPLRIERLHPDGQGTGDWRATLTNGRVVDIEVTSHTNPDSNNFWSQIHHKPGPQWPASSLAYKWTVLISDPEPEANKRRPVRQLVDALIPVLAAAEVTSTTYERMADIANRRLVSVLEFTNGGSDWDSQWANDAVAMTRKGISFEEWVPLWAKRSGFWYPQLLIDHFDDPPTARRVRVVRPPEPADKGMVYTLASMGGGVTLGDWEALSTAIQECINHKAGKDQLANAPDLKWLVVGLDGGHAASQLNDTSARRPTHLTLSRLSTVSPSPASTTFGQWHLMVKASMQY